MKIPVSGEGINLRLSKEADWLQKCSSPGFFVVDRPETYSATHSKNCIFSYGRFGLKFFIFLLRQVKITEGTNTRHVYLLGIKKNKHTSRSLLLATVGLKILQLEFIA